MAAHPTRYAWDTAEVIPQKKMPLIQSLGLSVGLLILLAGIYIATKCTRKKTSRRDYIDG